MDESRGAGVAVGSTVGPYEILAPLGAGGMGEVFRARDTRLGRLVAIKVLHTKLPGNRDLRARFDREARAISSLSHPHICTLYDVGADGAYLVMEMLEGEPLSERIARGPLPVSQVLRYGAQIADALDHAHRAGIIHRDLKPGNIMITPTGAKLLDFGLARLAETPALVSTDRSTLTEPMPLTAEGGIVGTVQYMSPEQVEGKPLDHRTDMFSLGSVLYEMTAGRRPFHGGSPSQFMAAIVANDPPPLRTSRPEVPVELERIIRTALEKNPDDRWQSAQDVARQLRWLAETSVPQVTAAIAPGRRLRRTTTAIVATALVTAAVSWVVAVRRSTDRPAPPPVRLQVATPPDVVPVSGFDTNNFAVSPDGRRVVFTAMAGGKRSLFVRDLDSYTLRSVEGSDGAFGPFWSPDSRWIGFSAKGRLWKVRDGEKEPPSAICDVAVTGVVATWGGGTILYSEAVGGGRRQIMKVSGSGGTPSPATVVDSAANEFRHVAPRFLPGGKRFVYQVFRMDSVERVLRVQTLGVRDGRDVLRNVSNAAFAGGRLLYVRDGVLLAQDFDADGATVTGDPVTLASNVAYFYATAGAEFDASPDGVIVFRTDTSAGELVEVDRSGAVVSHLGRDESFFSIDIERQGRRAAVAIMNRGTGLGDIWIYDLARGVRERFTSDPGMEVYPLWSPDGQSIVYSRTGGGIFPYLVRRRLNESRHEVIAQAGTFDVATSFSPDGSMLYLTRRDPRMSERIVRYSVASKKFDSPVAESFFESSPEVSPDGRWLAFVTQATGTQELYVQDLTGRDLHRVRISTQGGRRPRWSADGRELFFLSDGQLTSARAGENGGFSNPVLQPLFPAVDVQDYAVTPRGTFLFSRLHRRAVDSLFHVMITN